MKHFFIFLLSLTSYSFLSAQTNAEIIGKTVTDSIQIVDGAVSGHILQSADAQGLAEWVDPEAVHDDLGNHIATMKLHMKGNDLNLGGGIIDSAGSIFFAKGPIIDPSLSGFLTIWNASLNMQCNNIDSITRLLFCPTANGLPASTLTVVPSPAGIDEMILANGPAGPPAGVGFGVGGPVNPPPAPPPFSVATLAGGGVVPPLYNFAVYGDAWAIDWWAFSDARFKREVEDFNGALEKIARLRPVTYELDHEKLDFNSAGGRTFGFLAQDLIKVAPELVRQRSDGYFLVKYQGLIPILTEGIQELAEEMKSMQHKWQTELEALEAENEKLSSRMKALEELVRSKPRKRKRGK